MYIVNGRFLAKPIAGVGRFSLEICKALKKKGLAFRLVVPKKYEGKLENTYGFDIDYFGQFDSHIWEQIFLHVYMKMQSHLILINFSGLGPVFYKNKVSTVHDVSFLVNPKWFSKSYSLFYKNLTPITCRNSKFIITVSQFSKSEIIKYLHIKDDKIVVLYNATDFHLRTKTRTKFNYKNYILGVFSLDPRKNFQLLIEAFNQLNLVGFKLILVGKAFTNFNNSSEDFSGSENVIFTGYVTDDELLSLYADATLFVYPSLYEGFGIPPLEALVLGKNVLLSDIPVFKEIFGDTVNYFKSNSLQDLKEKMNALIANPLKPSKENIADICSKYNWDESATVLIKKLKDYE